MRKTLMSATAAILLLQMPARAETQGTFLKTGAAYCQSLPKIEELMLAATAKDEQWMKSVTGCLTAAEPLKFAPIQTFRVANGAAEAVKGRVFLDGDVSLIVYTCSGCTMYIPPAPPDWDK